MRVISVGYRKLEDLIAQFCSVGMPSHVSARCLVAFSLIVATALGVLNRNWIWGDSSDHWIYVRAFMEPLRYLQPPFSGGSFYYYDRQPWTFVGGLFYQVFSDPAMADIALHLFVAFVYILLLTAVLARLFAPHIGMLISLMSFCCPVVLYTLGTNYVAGAVTLYILAFFYCVVTIVMEPFSRRSFFGAGFFCATAALCHLYALNSVASIAIAAFLVDRRKLLDHLGQATVYFFAGFLSLFLPLGVINSLAGGDFWFFRTTIQFAQGLHYFDDTYLWGEQPSNTLLILLFPIIVSLLSVVQLVSLRLRSALRNQPGQALVLYLYTAHSTIILLLFLLRKYVVTKPDIYYINYVLAFLAVGALVHGWMSKVNRGECLALGSGLAGLLIVIYHGYQAQKLDLTPRWFPRDHAIYWYALVVGVFVAAQFVAQAGKFSVLRRGSRLFAVPILLLAVFVNDRSSTQNLTKFLGPEAWTRQGIKYKQDNLSVTYRALSFIAPRCERGNCLMILSEEDAPKWIFVNATNRAWSAAPVQVVDSSCAVSNTMGGVSLTAPNVILFAVTPEDSATLLSRLDRCGIQLQIDDRAAFVRPTETVYLQAGTVVRK